MRPMRGKRSLVALVFPTLAMAMSNWRNCPDTNEVGLTTTVLAFAIAPGPHTFTAKAVCRGASSINEVANSTLDMHAGRGSAQGHITGVRYLDEKQATYELVLEFAMPAESRASVSRLEGFLGGAWSTASRLCIEISNSSLFETASLAQNYGSTPCSDGSSCPSHNTCCPNQWGSMGCCDEPDAHCCSDNVHCCPSNSYCTGSPNWCADAVTNEVTPARIHQAPYVGVVAYINHTNQ